MSDFMRHVRLAYASPSPLAFQPTSLASRSACDTQSMGITCRATSLVDQGTLSPPLRSARCLGSILPSGADRAVQLQRGDIMHVSFHADPSTGRSCCGSEWESQRSSTSLSLALALANS